MYEKIFKNLETNINNLLSELQDINNNIYASEVKTLLKKVETIINFLSSKNNAWLSNNNFNPGNKFLELIDQLYELGYHNDIISELTEKVKMIFLE